MKQRPRIYYSESQKAQMWERWRKGDTRIAGRVSMGKLAEQWAKLPVTRPKGPWLRAVGT